MIGNLFLGKDNLFWGMQFRTCKNFWDFADSKSSLNPKNSYKYKSHTAITSIAIRCTNRLRIERESAIIRHCEANRRFAQSNPNKIKSARSANPCPTRHTEATKSPKYPFKSFCFVWLSPKVESHLPLNPNLPIVQGKRIIGDSQVAKMDSSLTAFAQNDECCVDCFWQSPRNDEIFAFCDSANHICNDGFIYKSPTISRESPANPRHLRRI